MIKRPLVLTSVVFILLLIVLRLTGAPYLSHDPVNRTEDGEKSIYGCFQDDVITLYGVISDYSFQESFGVTTTKLNLKDVSVLDQSQEYRKITHLGQSILVYLNTEEVHAIGNTVLVSGRLSFFEPATNPGQFDAEKYYANRDVLFAVKKASVIREMGVPGIRQWLKEAAFVQERVLENYLSEANAAIMKAMLLGNKEELDEGIEKLYQDNGIAHILAISGVLNHVFGYFDSA